MFDPNRKHGVVYGDSPAAFHQDGVYYDGAGKPVPAKFAGMTNAQAAEAGFVPGQGRTIETAPKRVEAVAVEKDEFIEGRTKELAEKHGLNKLRQIAKAIYDQDNSLPKPDLRGSKEDIARWIATHADE